VFEIYDTGGRLVATTALSRSWRGSQTLGANMASTIRQELGLRSHGRAFARLVECPLTREDFLALVLGADATDPPG
jgi:hypothetical protein